MLWWRNEYKQIRQDCVPLSCIFFHLELYVLVHFASLEPSSYNDQSLVFLAKSKFIIFQQT